MGIAWVLRQSSRFLGIINKFCVCFNGSFKRDVGKNCVEAFPGWPGKLVGGGKAFWKRGQPTDDSGR